MHSQLLNDRRNPRNASSRPPAARTAVQPLPDREHEGCSCGGTCPRCRAAAEPELKHARVDTAPIKVDPPGTDDSKDMPTVSGCTGEQIAMIRQGLNTAVGLARIAFNSITPNGPDPKFQQEYHNNFGPSLSPAKAARIFQVYEHIQATLNSKNFVCGDCNPKGNAPVNDDETDGNAAREAHICAQGDCPGNMIRVCPLFGKPGCPPGAAILHEAAHNAGACGDVPYWGSGYPPQLAESNAYSYERFAVDIAP